MASYPISKRITLEGVMDETEENLVKKLPPHIPDFLPPFPSPHTYKETPVLFSF
jgi:hypothetical protein